MTSKISLSWIAFILEIKAQGTVQVKACSLGEGQPSTGQQCFPHFCGARRASTQWDSLKSLNISRFSGLQPSLPIYQSPQPSNHQLKWRGCQWVPAIAALWTPVKCKARVGYWQPRHCRWSSWSGGTPIVPEPPASCISVESSLPPA